MEKEKYERERKKIKRIITIAIIVIIILSAIGPFLAIRIYNICCN